MRYLTMSIVKEGKWYVARAAELGVASQGKTVEEARRNLQEAVELFAEESISVYKQLPREIPLVSVLQFQP